MVADLKRKIEEAVQYDACGYGTDTSLPVGLGAGRRVEVEFWCSTCQHYIYLKLNTQLSGNHVVICPNCGHKHYRFVENGIITCDRWVAGRCIADEIMPMKSAAVPKAQRRVRGEMAIIREMEACGLLK